MRSKNRPNEKEYHNLSLHDLLLELNTDSNGLTHEECEKRLKQYGYNIITPEHKNSVSRRYLNKINSYSILILLSLLFLSVIF